MSMSNMFYFFTLLNVPQALKNMSAAGGPIAQVSTKQVGALSRKRCI